MGTTASLTAERVLRRLEWHVIRRLDGRLQGDYRTLLRGHGTDFRDVREYETGDDVRHVDWNVTARMDEMFVRQYAEDRELTVWLLLDHSPSMGFGPVQRTKDHVLCEVAATIAQLFVRGGNRIGAIVYDNHSLRTIPPRQGRNQVLVIINELLRPVSGQGPSGPLSGRQGPSGPLSGRQGPSGPLSGRQGPSGPLSGRQGPVTDLGKLLGPAARTIRRRSLVVLISDFISSPGWERSLLRLTERHEVVAVRLVDPREFELPDAGLLVVEDAETGEQLMVDSSDPEFRARLRHAGEERELAVRDAARRAAVDLHVISTDDDLVTAFVRIVVAPAAEALMTFRSPWMLGLLLAIPAMVAAYASSQRRRSQRATVLSEQGLVTTSFQSRMRVRRHVPFGLFAAALTVLVAGMARPMATVKTPRREGTVILAVDVSNSMKAADVKPTRFDAAKAAAKAFVERQPPAVRIGVVAFGDGAVVVQTPTIVHADVVRSVDRLSVAGGTSLGQGLVTSLSAIAGRPLTIDPEALASDSAQVDIGFFGSASVVLLSDGEETSRPDPVSVAEVASVAGVRVHTIGIGTEAGAVVQIDGFSVATALDSALLEQVASITDGTYHAAGDTAGLAAISKTIDLRFKVVAQHTEVTGLFSAAGAVLLLAGALLSVLWFGRVV